MAEQRAAAATVMVGGASDDGLKLAPGAGGKLAEMYPMLRQLGGRAYQLLAATRAADHFIAQDNLEDRNCGSWLIVCAVGLADELAADLDVLAKNLKAAGGDAALLQSFQKLRARTHQLHAATRAADHFLDQENNVDHSTGSWLIACALGLAERLANELEELANGMRRPSVDAAPVSEPASGRRAGGAQPLRAATL